MVSFRVVLCVDLGQDGIVIRILSWRDKVATVGWWVDKKLGGSAYPKGSDDLAVIGSGVVVSEYCLIWLDSFVWVVGFLCLGLRRCWRQMMEYVVVVGGGSFCHAEG